MPWGDKAVSPCVYTPGAGEMTLPDFGVEPIFSISDGKLVPSRGPFFRIVAGLRSPSPSSAGYGGVLVTRSGKVIVPGTAGVTIFSDVSCSQSKFVAYPSSRATYGLEQIDSGRIIGAGFYSDDDCDTMTALSTVTNGAVFKIGSRVFRSQYPSSTILLSSTDGTNWVSGTGLTGNYIWGVTQADNGYYFCSDGVGVYRSTNNCVSWTLSYSLGDAYFGWLKSIGGRVILNTRVRQCFSDDYGESWTRVDKASGGAECGLIMIGPDYWRWFSQNNYFAKLDLANLATVNLNQKSPLYGAPSGMLVALPIRVVSPTTWLFVFGSWLYEGRWCEPEAATLEAANAFQPPAPAKLASLPSAVLTLDTTGAAGTVALYLQHYNDEVGRWESYSGVANDDTDASFTLIGSYDQVTNNISLPTLPARAGEMVRCRLKFASTDGTAPAPAFVSLSLSWTSDVTAPDAPTISKILSAATADSVPGYRADFGALPAGSRHLILEGQLNSGGWLPFSARAKFEESQGYMKFRGDIAAVEAAGERNEQHISAAKGLALGDVVQVRIAAEDDVGNRSAFTASDALTIAPAVAAATPVLSIEDGALASGNTGTLRVHLHGQTTQGVTVDYTSVDDTASDPEDYSGVSGTITFNADPADPHQYRDIAINANGSSPTPGETQYKIVLSNPANATIEKAEGIVEVQSLSFIPVPSLPVRVTSRTPRYKAVIRSV